MQNAADLAAAGGINYLKSIYPSATATTAAYARDEGKSAAKLHGFTGGVDGRLSKHSVKGLDAALYSSTNYTAAANYTAVEAVVSQPVPLGFAGIFMSSSPTIVARSVTMLNTSAGDCMESLNLTTAKAFSMQGNVTVNVPCGIADNPATPMRLTLPAVRPPSPPRNCASAAVRNLTH